MKMDLLTSWPPGNRQTYRICIHSTVGFHRWLRNHLQIESRGRFAAGCSWPLRRLQGYGLRSWLFEYIRRVDSSSGYTRGCCKIHLTEQ